MDVSESVLAPNQSMELNAIACLDDTTNHKDQVHIAVAEGENVVVPVSARGTGTTIFCHERLRRWTLAAILLDHLRAKVTREQG